MFVNHYLKNHRALFIIVMVKLNRSQMSSPRMEEMPRQPSPMADTRGSSPYQESARGPSPIHGFSEMHRSFGPLETLRGIKVE